MKPKIGIIIQARMASTRLPNKIMKPLAGKAVLWHVVERCKKSKADQVIVATSTNKENDIIEEFCKKYNYPCFRDSEEDVLSRYYECAKKYGVDIIIRITSDCPLISPGVINELIEKFQKEDVDYASNVAQRSFPRGLDCEIFSFNALEKAYKLAKEKSYKEHVTAFIYNHPKMFKISPMVAEGELNRPDYRLCIDTIEDYNLLSIIYNKFYRRGFVNTLQVINFLDKNPKLAEMNIQSELQHLQKNVKQGIGQKFTKEKIIPYAKQYIDDSDLLDVIKTLKSNWLTTGPKVREFEEKFAKVVGAKYAVAVSSGTAALHVACLSARLKQGDELITSPMTFAASANCALYCNAKPVFVDIKKNGLIDENKIKKKITNKTKIVIPVHYTGLPCEMKKIQKIAKKHNLVVIEDACHALGARYKKSKIGDGKYSDMCVFSFHPVKHITTGEGGMITTNSKKFYVRLLMFRNHGITKNPQELTRNDGPWYYEIQELGNNYRITDFQCALGISQLGKVNKFIKRRREIAKKYDLTFKKEKNIEIIKEGKELINPYHLYVLKVKDKETRLRLFNYLKESNILCQIHYIPVYWHPYYQKLGYRKGLCPEAEKFYERIISLPMYYKLSDKEQKYIIFKIKEFFRKT